MLTQLFDLSGRSALVTGASKGLGRQLAVSLSAAGANTVLTARDQSGLDEVACEIERETTIRPRTVVADLYSRDAQDRLISALLNDIGQPDILVNNAGRYTAQTIETIEDEAWDSLLELNLSSAARLTRGLAPGMVKRGWGRIINVSSILAIGSRRGAAAYSASKAALIGMTRAFALELGPFGVTVNCLAPGAFNAAAPEARPTDLQRENFARTTALGRWGRPMELTGPALMLASDAGSYITGSVIVVDGGALCHTLY